jgi:hypothetical protein
MWFEGQKRGDSVSLSGPFSIQPIEILFYLEVRLPLKIGEVLPRA